MKCHFTRYDGDGAGYRYYPGEYEILDFSWILREGILTTFVSETMSDELTVEKLDASRLVLSKYSRIEVNGVALEFYNRMTYSRVD